MTALTTRPAKARPQLEELETRLTPAGAVFLSNSTICIDGTNQSDTATVTRNVGRIDNPFDDTITVRLSGVPAQTFSLYKRVGLGWGLNVTKIQFLGFGGSDVFDNRTSVESTAYGGEDTDWLYGGSGKDTLYGGGGADWLYGQNGTDILYGEDGNDRLFGGAGRDWLHGGANNDFLDKGEGTNETVDGGTGYDFNAYVWAVNGASYDDVFQQGSPTCWLAAAISSAAFRGVNFANRISYLGNGAYQVGLYDTDGAYAQVRVGFSGDLVAADPDPNPADEGESWVVLVQRAYLQSRGLDLTVPPRGSPAGPLAASTGRASTTYFPGNDMLSALTDFVNISSALQDGKNVVASTKDDADDLATDLLVTDHAYTVLRVEFDGPDCYVVMRNPWGDRDGGDTTYGNPDDAIIRLSWGEFHSSLESYTIN